MAEHTRGPSAATASKASIVKSIPKAMAVCMAAVLCTPALAHPVRPQEAGPTAGSDARAQTRYDRAKPDSWRGRPEWTDFKGARDGYWYAPGYGYQPADGRWAGHAWTRGDVLPAADRVRFVQEPAFYGLRPPPAGYRWVYFDNNLLLMQVTTGLVSDVAVGGY